MSDQWIKSLGMGARKERFPPDWTHYQDGFFRTAVTFRTNSSLHAGHGIVYYGSGWRLVFAVGTVTSEPYRINDSWTADWPWVIDVELHHQREFIQEGIPLEDLNVEERDLRVSIKRHSHIRLSPAELEEAARLLQ
jgi:hypothetical protein